MYCLLLVSVACLFFTPGAQAGDEEPDFRAIEATLNGEAEPLRSSLSCGFRLLAAPAGPQIALFEPLNTAVVALAPGEEASISIPMRIQAGTITISAEATLLGSAPVEVSLSLDTTTTKKVLQAGEPCTIKISQKPDAAGSRIRLRAGATGTATTAVRWRHVRARAGAAWYNVPLSVAPLDYGEGPPSQLPNLRKPIEDALIEWDWRMQDGIGTARQPSTYAEAIEQTLRRGDALIKDLRPPSETSARWETLRHEARQMPTDGDERRWENLWLRLHRLRREIALGNPQMPSESIVFVKQVPSIFSHQLTQYYGSCARPGGGVFVLDAPGRSMDCRQLAAGALPEGSYQHPEISCDGRHLLFAFCHAETTPKNREQHLDRFYHLYKMTPDGRELRQLTTGPYDDFSPRFLPDGKILFISTRRGGFHRCGRGPCPVYTLALVESDGSNPRPISYHETHEWDPAVMNDGRIIYTRWDYVDRHAVHYQQLWTVRPDGSDVRIFYGNNTFNPVGVWEAQPVPGSSRVMATAAAHHAMTAGSIILLDVTQEIDGLEPITRLTPDVPFPESEAPVLPKWRAPVGISKPLPVQVEAARWPGHCYRSPYPLSEKYFLAAYSFDSLIGEPKGNPANMFGLYLMDAFGNKELLYRDPNIASLWPVPLRPRPGAPQVPSIIEEPAAPEGSFLLVDVYSSWPPLPRGSVKRLRVVQVLPKSTPHINDPSVGIPNASPGKQVLGTVPVESDGSAWFTAPAGVPLAFQALDERGMAVQIMRSVTYLQPGETTSCIGCHEPRTLAPPAGRAPEALARPPSPLQPGPDGSKPLSYPILVQPVLDRHCVRCHSPEKPEGGVALTGAPQGHYTISYNALAPRVPHSAWQGGDFRRANSEPTSAPGHFGARGSRLMKLLLKGHEDVILEANDIERLATWMDANVLFYGTFDRADQARQKLGHRIEGPNLK